MNLFFVLFLVFVVVMLVLDLGVFHKKDHVEKGFRWYYECDSFHL